MAIGAGALRAGRAVIELSLLTKPVFRQLRALQMRVRAVGMSFARMGSFGGGGMGGGFAGLRTLFIGSAGAVAAAWPVKLAANIELATAQMSVFTGSTESARGAMLDLLKFSAVASQSPEDMAAQMRLLMTRDINAEDSLSFIKSISVLAAGSTDEFQQLTKAFADVRSATRLNGEEMRQFKNTAFNPYVEIMKKTGETMDEVKTRMEAGGVSFNEVADALQASVRQGGLFHGMLGKISGTLIGQMRMAFAQLKLAVLPLGDALLPILKRWGAAINGILPGLGRIIKANAALVRTVLAVVAAVAFAAIAFTTMGLGLMVLQIAASGFATVIGAILGLLAFLVSPLGLVVIGLTALAGWFFTATEAGRDMVTNLAAYFKRLWEIAGQTFNGIADALKAGDLRLAGQIAMAGLNLVWLQGTKKLSDIWRDFKDVGVRTIIEMIFNIQKHWTNLWSALESGWTMYSTNFASGWQNLNDKILDADARRNLKVKLEATTDEGERLRLKMETAREIADRANKTAGDEKKRRSDEKKTLGDIETERKAALAEVEDARRQAQAFQDQAHNDALDAAKKKLKDAEERLKLLRKQAADAAANAPGLGDFGLGKDFAHMALAGAAAAGKGGGAPEAFFDTRLAWERFGPGAGGGASIEQQQLDVQKKQLKVEEDIEENTRTRRDYLMPVIP